MKLPRTLRFLSLVTVLFLTGCTLSAADPVPPSVDAGAPCDAAVAPEAAPADACRANLCCFCDGGYVRVQEPRDNTVCDLKTAFALCEYLQLHGDIDSCDPIRDGGVGRVQCGR